MKIKTPFLFGLLLFVFAIANSCGDKKAIVDAPKNSDVNSSQIKIMKSIDINETYTSEGKTDPFTTLSTKIIGDTLLVEVQYGGGCEQHEFTMHTNKIWMKSLPPQLNLWLEHQSNNDMCRALITETLFFDLKPIQHAGSKSVDLILNGDRENRIRYIY